MVFPDPFDAPEMLPAGNTAMVQEKLVLAVVPESMMSDVPVEQMVCKAGVASTFGVGLTVTTTLIGNPGHPFADGVIV